jgi:hypothetical protein
VRTSSPGPTAPRGPGLAEARSGYAVRVKVRGLPLVALLVVATGSVSGCGGGQSGDVDAVARQFYQALLTRDGAAACAVLAPQTKQELEKSAKQACAGVILREGIHGEGGPRRTDVYGTAARVQLGEDTAFLARFQDGWKVMAAGCRRQPHDQPFDCQVSGG